MDRLGAALHQLKQCRSEAERRVYHIVLAAVAPKRETQAQASKHRDEGHSIARVAARLDVQPGSRYVKRPGLPSTKRPYVFDQAITAR